LEQPIWVQRLASFYTLSNAVKLSAIVWMGITLGLWYVLVKLTVVKLLPFIPIYFWLVFGALIAWPVGVTLADLKIEEQTVLRFMKDYLKFYFRYAIKRRRYYFYDGIRYIKPTVVLKSYQTPKRRKL
ncbi:TPA: hypothetical protein QCN85_005981, partial [Bacillus anthracis]|nr:hypothetical protein [Bacillus anthracis]